MLINTSDGWKPLQIVPASLRTVKSAVRPLANRMGDELAELLGRTPRQTAAVGAMMAAELHKRFGVS